jgi:uncharacterized protein YjbJ (UPF0337 family)
MKKVLAIVLALIMACSVMTMAFAADAATPADAPTDPAYSGLIGSVKSILDKITGIFSNGDGLEGLLAQIEGIINKIKELVTNLTGSNSADVLGIVDQLEAKIGSFGLAKDILSRLKELITNLKQKIKDLYAGNKEPVVEATAAAAPSDTGSSAAGIAAFAAVSVAAAAAVVCTRKKVA